MNRRDFLRAFGFTAIAAALQVPAEAAEEWWDDEIDGTPAPAAHWSDGIAAVVSLRAAAKFPQAQQRMMSCGLRRLDVDLMRFSIHSLMPLEWVARPGQEIVALEAEEFEVWGDPELDVCALVIEDGKMRVLTPRGVIAESPLPPPPKYCTLSEDCYYTDGHDGPCYVDDDNWPEDE